jgi:hypothetical protein
MLEQPPARGHGHLFRVHHADGVRGRLIRNQPRQAVE